MALKSPWVIEMINRVLLVSALAIVFHPRNGVGYVRNTFIPMSPKNESYPAFTRFLCTTSETVSSIYFPLAQCGPYFLAAYFHLNNVVLEFASLTWR